MVDIQVTSVIQVGQKTDLQPGARLIVHNLFALEAFHIAEALGIPSLTCSPCLIPYPAPATFEQHLRNMHPELYNLLWSSPPGLELICFFFKSGHREGSPNIWQAGAVGAKEVEHWMWALLTERWAGWRYARLRLPPMAYQGHDRSTLPPAPLLLYGISPALLDVPAYWPPSVHICGFWQQLQVDWGPSGAFKTNFYDACLPTSRFHAFCEKRFAAAQGPTIRPLRCYGSPSRSCRASVEQYEHGTGMH